MTKINITKEQAEKAEKMGANQLALKKALGLDKPIDPKKEATLEEVSDFITERIGKIVSGEIKVDLPFPEVEE